MTATEYLINGLFVLVVLRQARERQLDMRSLVVPLARARRRVDGDRVAAPLIDVRLARGLVATCDSRAYSDGSKSTSGCAG